MKVKLRLSRISTLPIFVVAVAVTVAMLCFFIVTTSTRLEDIEKQNYNQELQLRAHGKQIPYHAKFMKIVRELVEKGKKMSPEEIVEIANIITASCVVHAEIGLTPDKIFAVMEQESNFDPTAISYANAYGLMQCIRATFERHLPDMGYKMFSIDLALNPVVNVEVGVRELVQLRKYWLEEGVVEWSIVVTSYYWGVRATQRLFLDKDKRDSQYSDEVFDKIEKWRKE